MPPSPQHTHTHARTSTLQCPASRGPRSVLSQRPATPPRYRTPSKSKGALCPPGSPRCTSCLPLDQHVLTEPLPHAAGLSVSSLAVHPGVLSSTTTRAHPRWVDSAAHTRNRGGGSTRRATHVCKSGSSSCASRGLPGIGEEREHRGQAAMGLTGVRAGAGP